MKKTFKEFFFFRNKIFWKSGKIARLLGIKHLFRGLFIVKLRKISGKHASLQIHVLHKNR